MSSESEMLLYELKELGFEILVDKFPEEIIAARKTAESIKETMPDSHHIYDEPSNVFTPQKIDTNNNE